MKKDILSSALSEFPNKRLEMPLLIKNDPLSTALFFKIALDSVVADQTWYSPTGTEGQMIQEGWLNVKTIKKIKKSTQPPYDLAWVTNIFEQRIDAIMADEEYGVIFNSSEIKVLNGVQEAIANDPKTRESNVQESFYVNQGASLSEAPLPSYPHTA